MGRSVATDDQKLECSSTNFFAFWFDFVQFLPVFDIDLTSSVYCGECLGITYDIRVSLMGWRYTASQPLDYV